MRGLTPEAMVLEEIRQQKLVTPEEYLLIQQYIQTRTEHSSASQIREIHQAYLGQQISEATYLDTKAKLITRIRKEVKTREISKVLPEDLADQKPADRRPLLWGVAAVLTVLGVWGMVAASMRPTPMARVLQDLTLHPSGTLPLENYRKPDGTYGLDYNHTPLGSDLHLVW